MSNASTSGNIKHIDACIDLLQASGQYNVAGKQDEYKLAGLMMLSRVLDHNDIVSMRKVWEALDMSFMQRLLLSTEKTMITENEEPDNELLALVSVTVLSSFALMPECAASNKLKELYSILLVVLSQTRTVEVYRETLELLLKVLQHANIENNLAILPLSAVIARRLGDFEDDKSHTLSLSLIEAHFAYVSKLDKSTIKQQEAQTECITYIIEQIVKHDDIFKFALLGLLGSLLSYTTVGTVKLSDKSKLALRGVLLRVLSSKLTPELRNPPLILIGHLYAHFGSAWLLTSQHPMSSPERASEHSQSINLFTLSTQLSCVELRIMLDSADPNAVTSISRSLDPTIHAQLQLLTSCSTIIENVVTVIADMMDLSDDTNEVSSALNRLQNSLSELMSAVASFLMDVQAIYVSSVPRDSTIIMSLPVITLTRLLASYLTDNPRAELCSGLCLLFIELCSFDNRCQLSAMNTSASILTVPSAIPIMLPILAPCIAQITTDKGLMVDFVVEGGYDLCITWLQDSTLWPSLSTSHYMSVVEVHNENQEIYEEILTSFSGVLMNLIVLKSGADEFSVVSNMMIDALKLVPRLIALVESYPMKWQATPRLFTETRASAIATLLSYILYTLRKSNPVSGSLPTASSLAISSLNSTVQSEWPLQDLIHCTLYFLGMIITNRLCQFYAPGSPTLMTYLHDWILLISDVFIELVRVNETFRKAVCDNGEANMLVGPSVADMCQNFKRGRDSEAIVKVLKDLIEIISSTKA